MSSPKPGRVLTAPPHHAKTPLMSHISDSKLGRRTTLQVIGVGSLTAAGLVTLNGCSKGEEAGGGGGDPPGEGCNAPVDAASQQLRTSLQYVEVSQKEGQKCSTCAQYIADKHGACGGCQLFTGPVQPAGNCLSYAPKEGAAAG